MQLNIGSVYNYKEFCYTDPNLNCSLEIIRETDFQKIKELYKNTKFKTLYEGQIERFIFLMFLFMHIFLFGWCFTNEKIMDICEIECMYDCIVTGNKNAILFVFKNENYMIIFSEKSYRIAYKKYFKEDFSAQKFCIFAV